MQACVQCGLSIGESARFCPVCGTRIGDGVAAAAAVEAGAPIAPAPDPAAPASFEPAAGLVTELERAPGPASDADPEAAHLDAAPVIGHGAILDAEADAGGAELVADLAAEHAAASGAEIETTAELEMGAEIETGDETEPDVIVAESEKLEDPVDLAEPEESAEDVRERRMAEIAALLEFAGRCEDVNAARAAGVYGEAIVACLDVSEDPLAAEPVREDLLRGFDRLSFVLERQGLSEEALAVVDDAASLGLLDGEDGAVAPQRGALRDRREGLRRILYGDSAQL